MREWWRRADPATHSRAQVTFSSCNHDLSQSPVVHMFLVWKCECVDTQVCPRSCFGVDVSFIGVVRL